MDPVGFSPPLTNQVLSHHGILLGRQGQTIQNLETENQNFRAQVQKLQTQFRDLASYLVANPPASPHHLYNPRQDLHVTNPEPFTGTPNLCRGFFILFSLPQIGSRTCLVTLQSSCCNCLKVVRLFLISLFVFAPWPWSLDGIKLHSAGPFSIQSTSNSAN